MRQIDADVLKYVKFHGVTDWTPTEETSYQRGWNDAIDAIMRNAPTVEPKHGYWYVSDHDGYFQCSECDSYAHETELGNYCSSCGAKMDEVEDASDVDVVEVVRCKDCIHYWKNKPSDDVPVCLASPKDDAFCSEGERKEDEIG